MKREDIVFKDKCILLGIFGTKTFRYFEEIPGVIGYDIFCTWDTGNIIHVIHGAAEWADQIIFVLDNVHFPINVKDSITCEELALICSHEDLYNKTIFVKEDNVIDFDKNLVIN